jgi:multicomponent Na+:H+ antiporter subunit F
MIAFVAVLSIAVGVSVVATLWAVVRRPGVFDRVIGVGMVGTKTTVLLAFTGVLFQRLDAFVDIALTYALLNFIVTLVVARYFTTRTSIPGEPLE